MENFQNVTDRHRNRTNFMFQGFRCQRNKKLLHLLPFFEWQLILFKN